MDITYFFILIMNHPDIQYPSNHTLSEQIVNQLHTPLAFTFKTKMITLQQQKQKTSSPMQKMFFAVGTISDSFFAWQQVH
jgi:hypothetical protein